MTMLIKTIVAARCATNTIRVLTTLIGCGLAAGCQKEIAITKPITPVRVSSVSNLDTSSGYRYSANITAYTQVSLAFKSGGYVDSIQQRKGADGRIRPLETGDRIAEGEVLARVRESEYSDRVKQATAQLAQAQSASEHSKEDFARATKLLASASMTKSEYDGVRARHDSDAAALENAHAALAQSTTALKDCSVVSPMNGVILERNVELGTLAGTGTPAFVVADIHLVKVVFGVPDTTVSLARLGDPQTITTSSLNGEFHGRITSISPSADPKSRVFSVEVTIPNSDARLKPGMIATLSLGAGPQRHPVAAVPLGAIVHSSKKADGFAVFIVEDQGGKAVVRERDVAVGDAIGNMIGVTEGVKVGERVVSVGGTQVKDGEAVQVIP
jgi:RND family efflux transporter MFP subunit